MSGMAFCISVEDISALRLVWAVRGLTHRTAYRSDQRSTMVNHNLATEKIMRTHSLKLNGVPSISGDAGHRAWVPKFVPMEAVSVGIFIDEDGADSS